MPALDLFLPMPPSTNHLFKTFADPKTRTIRRVKTDEYVAWIREAGYRPLAGVWRRITEDQKNRLHWALFLTVYGLPEGADLSNRAKAVEDLICAMTGLRDRYTREIRMERIDTPHDTLGPCVAVWVATV